MSVVRGRPPGLAGEIRGASRAYCSSLSACPAPKSPTKARFSAVHMACLQEGLLLSLTAGPATTPRHLSHRGLFKRHLNAYDLYLRALAQYNRWSEEGFAEAAALARQALEIDPSYMPAAAMIAWSRTGQRFQGWGALSEADIAEAVRLARQALETARDDAETLWRAGY